MGRNGDSTIIKPINKAVVHRICSGQVILDLASAVKELVENSLDAGANSIEVRLKEYGGESFEVGDNGYGISPDNYQSATLKYHTSKISDFSDLQCLTFFGFRGEALSSLCALGNVTIETRTKNESVGTQLIFDHSGLIVSQKNIARQIGTTVTVAKLFSPLPVRYKEFHRNVRREYGRLLSLLHAYALIAKGVRFLCTNMTGRGPKSVVLRTQGSGSVKDNIITVFGTKTLACLEPLEFCVSDGCRIEGFVSKPGSGSGRGSGDRQFFYVNGRPVDMPKVTKLLNELYRSYNSQQYPMAVLNFILPTTAYDVNVTPDKRKIFLHDEGLLISALKESLDLLYTPNKYTYVINNLESSSQLGQAHTSLLSSSNAEKQEPSCVEDYEVTDDVNIKVDLFSEDNRPNVHSEELFHESKEDIMHDDNPENQKVDDAMTDSVSDTCEPKVKTPHDFAVFKCRSSVSELASPLEHSTASKKIKSYTEKAENSSLAQTTKSGFKGSGSISHLRQVQSNLSGFVIPNNRQHEEGSLLSEEPVLKKSMCGANANATEFVTPNKRQHEEGPLLTEEPVLKKWMFCADENAKHMKKDNIKVRRLGYCSEKDVCSTGNLTLRDEDESCFPALHDSRENMTPVESYKDLADDQRETLQVERSQEAGKEDATSENLERISLEDNVDMVASPMQTSDVDRMMKRDEVITYDGSKLTSDTYPDEKDYIARQADSKDITIARFDINRCRLKSSRGLLRCDKNASMQRKDKGRKRCYAAATLAKGPMVEDVNEKEAALAAAIKELERSFNKEDFKRMKVIGQFNLGFIIAKIDDDLFIIDQHASDEKYNFERLSQTTILNRQPLLCPLLLELSVAEEITISTHMDTFRRNGFDFIEDTSSPPGKRLLLSAVPYSKNITFGVGDIQELVAILVDEPAPSTTQCSGSRSISAICPSRVRAMLASRACRSSVMIGDALSKKSMETIVQHLSTLNSPWNCPHGRPTMRHLIDLATLYRS